MVIPTFKRNKHFNVWPGRGITPLYSMLVLCQRIDKDANKALIAGNPPYAQDVQNSLDPKGRFDFARLFASASLEGMGPAAQSRNKHPKQNQTVKPRQNYEADSERRSCIFDRISCSMYPSVMLIEENMLAVFRGEDGLCRLKPEYAAWYRYGDYPELLTEPTKAAKQADLLRDGSLKTVFTCDYFEELSDRADHGIVAMLAFTNLVPVLPITRHWIAFQHQGAGYTCRQITFIATVLEPKPAIKSVFLEVARANFHACGGRFEGPETDPELTESYLSAVHALGLTCGDQARAELCQSVYPVDATSSSMRSCFEDVGDLIYLTENECAKPLILFLTANSD